MIDRSVDSLMEEIEDLQEIYTCLHEQEKAATRELENQIRVRKENLRKDPSLAGIVPESEDHARQHKQKLVDRMIEIKDRIKFLDQEMGSGCF